MHTKIIATAAESSTEATTEAITLTESKRLIELEQIVARGKQTFIEVGEALAEIRDARLYRSDHPTFEAYCRAKWSMSKQHVYRLIECAPIAKSNPQHGCHKCGEGELVNDAVGKETA